MVGTTFSPPSYSWILPCCPCPVLVTEIRCRTDGSAIQLSFASNNHIHVDLVSVPPYTPNWNYLHSWLTDYRRVTRFNCFCQAHEFNELIDYMPMCPTSN